MDPNDDCKLGPGIGFTAGDLVPEDKISASPHFGKYDAHPWTRFRATAAELGNGEE